ncbi:MAG: hypothetical protein GEU78_01105 [Actinobacteria bacterium]|nr:hypothetical protein [Actinomycetota bacterium]
MDAQSVREHAQAHGDAVARNDLRTAGNDLAPEAMKLAQDVMGQLPRPVQEAEVSDVTSDGPAVVAQIRYRGESDEKVVESRWEERDGTPKIVDLRVV